MCETEKTCNVCGRIITDKTNITGLCPKHQKKANKFLSTVVFTVLAKGVHKYGPKILSAAIKVIKK